jgi:hypothetical protein
VAFEEDFEGFARDLLIEQQVLVMQDEQDRGGAGVEVLQIPALDAQRARAAVVLDRECVVVDLSWCQLVHSPNPKQHILHTESLSSRGSLRKGKTSSFRALMSTIQHVVSILTSPCSLAGDALISCYVVSWSRDRMHST